MTKVRNRGLPLLAAALLALIGVAAGGAARVQETLAAPQSVWANPENVYRDSGYSNTPGLAALQTSGEAVLAWEERDDVDHTGSDLITVHNDCATCDMGGVRPLIDSGWQLMNNPPAAAHDNLGRAHFAWYRQSGSRIEVYYARYANRDWEQVGPALVNFSNRKEVLLAVGPDNSLWMINGRHEVSFNLYHSPDGGNSWNDMGRVPTGNLPKDASLAVTSNGTVMFSWIDRRQDNNGDALVGVFRGNQQWEVFNVSNSRGRSTHNTWLAADRTGGMRLVYDDGNNCDPERCYEDVYYREWTPGGGWSPNIVNLSFNSGRSYQPRVVVDQANFAWVVWMDDSSRNYTNYRLMYSIQQGPGRFTRREDVVNYGQAQVKDPALDFSPGHVQLGFTSTISDPRRDNFYSYAVSGGQPVPIPTSTPVVRCPGQRFEVDLCPGDLFYNDVMALVSIRAIGGYSDRTFRPNNNTTRAQFAKVIVRALQLVAPAPRAQHFSDVPPDNLFHAYIEAAYQNGVIRGYADGTFRPFNNVTRGQAAKMIALGKRLRLPNPATPTFRDVPRNHPFYRYVEAAAAFDIMSGYRCGQNRAEPCPGAYFRPSNNTTRGQAAKIVNQGRLFNQPPTAKGTAEAAGTSVVAATAAPAGPQISAFSLTQVTQDDTKIALNIEGRNFGTQPGEVVVNGVRATIENWLDGAIVFRLGAGTPANTNNTVVLVRRADGGFTTSEPEQFVVISSTTVAATVTWTPK